MIYPGASTTILLPHGDTISAPAISRITYSEWMTSLVLSNIPWKNVFAGCGGSPIPLFCSIKVTSISCSEAASAARIPPGLPLSRERPRHVSFLYPSLSAYCLIRSASPSSGRSFSATPCQIEVRPKYLRIGTSPIPAIWRRMMSGCSSGFSPNVKRASVHPTRLPASSIFVTSLAVIRFASGCAGSRLNPQYRHRFRQIFVIGRKTFLENVTASGKSMMM